MEGTAKPLFAGKGLLPKGQPPTAPGQTEKIRLTVAYAESYVLIVITVRACAGLYDTM